MSSLLALNTVSTYGSTTERDSDWSASADDEGTGLVALVSNEDPPDRTPKIAHHNPLLLRNRSGGDGGGDGGEYGSAEAFAGSSDCNDDGHLNAVRRSGSLQDSIRSLVEETFRLPGKECSVREAVGTASVPNEIFNLIKNLVGAGALGLPSGVAAYANAPSAIFPASIVTLAMGAIFAYYFLLMGRICKVTHTTTYREAWDATVGERGSSLIALTTVLMAGLGNLAYSMILADTSRSLIMAAGIGITRTGSLVLVTVFALLPLCLAKNLSVLAPFSLVGMGAMVFTLVVMGLRYYDGTYDASRGGKFLEDLSDDLKPCFGDLGARGALTPNMLLLICMTFQAFFAHYNAPRYYMELKNNTIERFSTVVGSSFTISAVFYIIMTAFGFLTFGSHSNGFILNNYSTDDALASISRAAIAVAILFTYPLPFIGVRDGILDILQVPPVKQTSANLNVLTVVILAVLTLLAAHFDDLGMVNAVGGGSLGTLVVFVFPALMLFFYVRNISKKATGSLRCEAVFAVVLMCIGILMGSIGVWVAVSDLQFSVNEGGEAEAVLGCNSVVAK